MTSVLTALLNKYVFITYEYIISDTKLWCTDITMRVCLCSHCVKYRYGVLCSTDEIAVKAVNFFATRSEKIVAKIAKFASVCIFSSSVV